MSWIESDLHLFTLMATPVFLWMVANEGLFDGCFDLANLFIFWLDINQLVRQVLRLRLKKSILYL